MLLVMTLIDFKMNIVMHILNIWLAGILTDTLIATSVLLTSMNFLLTSTLTRLGVQRLGPTVGLHDILPCTTASTFLRSQRGNKGRGYSRCELTVG